MSCNNEDDCSGCSKKRTREVTNEVLDNKVRNLADLSENEVFNYNNMQELKQLSNDIAYVTGPQETRSLFVIDLASEMEKTDEQLIEILSNNLQESDPNVVFYISGFNSKRSRMSNDKKIIYNCEVCIFIISKRLISQLVSNGLTQIYYFIGNWKQTDKFIISSYRPEDNLIAKTNYSGIELPYESCLLNFESC